MRTPYCNDAEDFSKTQYRHLMVMAESTYENASGLMFVSLFVPYVYKFVIFLIVQDRKKNWIFL